MNHWEKVQHKIVCIAAAKTIITSWKSNDELVVFTNGCFDILHRGHVAYLAKAADHGHHLVVAVNTDASVKRQGKGSERPVNDEQSRALLLAALEYVDLVILFDADTPQELIRELLPSVLVKGADYDANSSNPNDPKYIVGANEIREAGSQVKTIPLEIGFSTTGIIEKLRK